jgi:hypothetical protein
VALNGGASVREESKIDEIVRVARVNRSKLGSPGEIIAPDRSSATSTQRVCINLDLTTVGVLVPLRRRSASEITPAAGSPKCAT